MNIIDTREPGRCRDIECREEIFWRIEKSGKRNPYNPPEPCPDCNGSGGSLAPQLRERDLAPTMLGESDLVPGWSQCEKCEGLGQIQKSHFATCIASAKFRKAKQ